MGYSINCIKNFKVDNLMDYSGDYGFIVKEEDWISTDWTIDSVIKIREVFEKYIPETSSIDLLPTLGEIDVYTRLNEQEAKWVNEILMEPQVCIGLCNKYALLNQKEIPHSIQSKLQWLYEHWKQGYFVFINY